MATHGFKHCSSVHVHDDQIGVKAHLIVSQTLNLRPFYNTVETVVPVTTNARVFSVMSLDSRVPFFSLQRINETSHCEYSSCGHILYGDKNASVTLDFTTCCDSCCASTESSVIRVIGS